MRLRVGCALRACPHTRSCICFGICLCVYIACALAFASALQLHLPLHLDAFAFAIHLYVVCIAFTLALACVRAPPSIRAHVKGHLAQWYPAKVGRCRGLEKRHFLVSPKCLVLMDSPCKLLILETAKNGVLEGRNSGRLLLGPTGLGGP